MRRRAKRLTSAATLYGQMAETPSYGSASEWRERQAWSIASLASNLRARSRLDRAMQEAACALRVFEDLENPYGRSHCYFQLGFCLRLLGDFDGAWIWLNEANALAAEHSFEPFRADAQMQLGEVLRCRGETEEARARLEESLARAENMGLSITQAFAQSALGAVPIEKRIYRMPAGPSCVLTICLRSANTGRAWCSMLAARQPSPAASLGPSPTASSRRCSI